MSLVKGLDKKVSIVLSTIVFASVIIYFGITNRWLVDNAIVITERRLRRQLSLVDEMTEELVQKLNEPTDMRLNTTTPRCGNIWFPCRPDVCSRHLSSDPKERAWDLLSPRLILTDEDRRKIEDLSSTVPVSDIIFVSATSSNHYDETQAMVRSLHTVVYPRVKNMTFVLLDIGLTPVQRNKTIQACRCHVIVFPFENFPGFFKERGCYTWKPLLVMAAMLKARKLVVYQDASISWKFSVDELLDRGDRIGLQLWGGKFMHNIPAATLKGMFDYFGDQPCAYLNYSQIQSGIIVFKQTPFIVRAVLEPWAKCGMEKDCFCPNTTHDSVNCNHPIKTLHMCHRFDQSALSMIATKLFTSDRYRYHMPDSDAENGRYVAINRNQRDAHYFDEIRSV